MNTNATEPSQHGQFINVDDHCFNDSPTSNPINTASTPSEFPDEQLFILIC